MNFNVRLATPADLIDIKKILSFYYLDTEHIKEKLSIVAEKDNKIIGCACLDKERVVELRSIAVLPSYRNNKVGSGLMEKILEKAASDTESIYLRTRSPVFFEKKGFMRLPHHDKKMIWKDCAQCDKYNICGQTAMKKVLKDVAAVKYKEPNVCA